MWPLRAAGVPLELEWEGPLWGGEEQSKFCQHSCQGQHKAAMSRTLAAQRPGSVCWRAGAWRCTVAGAEHAVPLASSRLSVRLPLTYRPSYSACHILRFLRLFQGKGKWIMLLNALNKGLKLALLSDSEYFTSLDSNGKQNVQNLLSTMTTD